MVENDLTLRRTHATVCLQAGLPSQQFVQEPLRLVYIQEPDVLFHSCDHFVHWMFPSTETRYLLLVKNANTLTETGSSRSEADQVSPDRFHKVGSDIRTRWIN